VLIRVAVLGILEVVVGRKSDANSIRPNSFAYRLDHLQRETAALSNIAAIVVISDVYVVMEKLVQKIPIRS
jgi:hypothetical protein